MKKFNVGIQLYGVRKTMAQDFEGTLSAIKAMGYDYVEFAGYFGRSGNEIADILAKLGLKCVSVHQSLDFFDKDLKAGADFLKAFGVKYSVIPWYEVGRLAGSDKWEETKALFNRVADGLKENGMMLGYHNHDFEFGKYEGKYLHDWIFESVPADRIFPELDTCWVKYAGLDPVEMIKKYSGRVPVVHLKDFVCTKASAGPVYALIDKDGKEIKNSKEENGFEFRPLGKGVQDFASILKACEECGTDTVIVEQDQSYDLPELEAARISRQYLKDKFGL